MTTAPLALLHRWLARQLPPAGRQWLAEQLKRVADDRSERPLHVALGMAPRRLGRTDLRLDEADLAAAHDARPGWDPSGWSVDQAARVLFLCEAGGTGDAFAHRFSSLCRSADAAEAVALYRGLPLYSSAPLLESQAAEGVRSNMRPVFEAVAHRNPYPREVFGEDRWNQMVLKALFIGSRLHPIQGLDERANPGLAAMLCDYAHERWAAGRPVSPELWRCVGPFADGRMLDDLGAVAASPDPLQRKAAALALASCPAPEARELLGRQRPLADEAASGRQGWDMLERELEA